MEKEIYFELDTVADTENGIIKINDYNYSLGLVNKILDENPAFIIESEEAYKDIYKTRAKLNKIVDAIDRKRIDTIDDFTAIFREQCNTLKLLLSKRIGEYTEEIKKWKESQNENTTTKKLITATLKFYDEKLIKKIKDFAVKNNIDFKIK